MANNGELTPDKGSTHPEDDNNDDARQEEPGISDRLLGAEELKIVAKKIRNAI